jgi:putative hydrolase of the HAD superfamily
VYEIKTSKAGENVYHNIVFDLGGVVVNYSPRDYLVDHFYNERIENQLFSAVFGSEEWQLADMGKLSWDEAAAIFTQRGQDMDLAFEMQTLLDEWTDMLTTRKATVALMRLLKNKGFGLYYLSNISLEVLRLLEVRDFWQLFDGGLTSCQAGVIKPDLAIYRQLLDKYGLIPQETIFTDDARENTAAAFEVGITGIQFKSVKNFCKMLVTYGIDI